MVSNYHSPVTSYQLPVTNYQLPITKLKEVKKEVLLKKIKGGKKK
ncbi:MAG: hypothetical protein AB1414_09950 [bacterium]